MGGSALSLSFLLCAGRGRDIGLSKEPLSSYKK